MAWRISTGWRSIALFLATVSMFCTGALLLPVEAMAQKTERVAAASPGGTSGADPLARVIEGAKREGVVDATLQASITPR